MFKKEYLYRIRNPHAIQIYIICCILLTKFKNENECDLEIDFFKKNLGIQNQYNNIKMLKDRVLETARKEINGVSDIFFDYKLIKTGKRYTDITLSFSKNKNSTKHLDGDHHNTALAINNSNQVQFSNEQENKIENTTVSSSICLQLRSYGVSEERTKNLLGMYGVGPCQESIYRLLKEIEKGTPIKNTAGYLIKCIENHNNQINSAEISMAMAAEEKLKTKKNKIQQERFAEFDRYISRNEHSILSLIVKYYSNEKLFNKDDINMLQSLYELLSEYKDIAKNNTPLTVVSRIDGKENLLTYKAISDIANRIDVADKMERVKALKKELKAKKAKLSTEKEQSKNILEKEISNITMKIAELV